MLLNFSADFIHFGAGKFLYNKRTYTVLGLSFLRVLRFIQLSSTSELY